MNRGSAERKDRRHGVSRQAGKQPPESRKGGLTFLQGYREDRRVAGYKLRGTGQKNAHKAALTARAKEPARLN